MSPFSTFSEHAGEVNRIFRRAELRRVAQLSFGELVHCAIELNRGRDDVDAFFHAFKPDRLRAEDAAVGD